VVCSQADDPRGVQELSLGREPTSLTAVFDGWQGYETSLEHAVDPLTSEQLRWRPAAHLRSVGELARHISLGRLIWSLRMDAPGAEALAARVREWKMDGDGNRVFDEVGVVGAEDASELVRWLQASWRVIDATLGAWSVQDLAVTYHHVWCGDAYDVSRQWTLWRILSHDIHHGGEMALLLGLQRIEAVELGGLFGHIVLPPRADATS
jgi:uncharacterized damage-inducible protein DinB